jgi:hypothetical protein
LFFYYYIKGLNGGGSFTLSELYEQFITQESKENLLKEMHDINVEFSSEDWELHIEIKELYNKFGKNYVKKVVGKLQTIIANEIDL